MSLKERMDALGNETAELIGVMSAHMYDLAHEDPTEESYQAARDFLDKYRQAVESLEVALGSKKK